MQEAHTWFLVGMTVLLLFFIGFQDDVMNVTGLVTATGGNTTITDQTALNPNFGAIKGKFRYQISDNGVIIDDQAGVNASLYFMDQATLMSNYSLVRNHSGQYLGTLLNVDADNNASTCAANNYTTNRLYYDANSNNNKEDNETFVYKVTIDANGCYAMKLPSGGYGIYN